jgi:tRNA (guanine26-N2/guanine27-N2)-dimethyltransferase
VRMAARHGLAAEPKLSYSRGHWYSAYVKLATDKGRRAAALDQLGFAVACSHCWDRRIVPGEKPSAACAACGQQVRIAGPLWIGRLWDVVLLRRLLADERPLGAGKQVRAALAGWLEEAESPALFYDLHAAARHVGGAAVTRLDAIHQRLAAMGHPAVRTHFAKVGIKTTASAQQILDLVPAKGQATA